MIVDVAIVGGGPVGASVALALAPTSFSIALIEPRRPPLLPAAGFDQRVYALNRRSRRFLERCGIWQHLLMDRIAPVREMRVFGDQASQLDFSAYRNGVPELAAIVEEANLQQALQRALSSQSNLAVLAGVACLGATWDSEKATLSLSDGQQIAASLVIAADGADSALRSAAGISVRVHEYGQTGVVANFRAGQPHCDTAFQWFVEGSVLALLPLPANHMSMVWSVPNAQAGALLSLTAEQLAEEVQRMSDNVIGLQPTGVAAGFALRRMQAARLIAPRLALVGDTAHNVHPLAGQGLNLGFGDAESLAAVLATSGTHGDPGAYALLRRYERSRREDHLAMEVVTEGLQLLFASTVPGMKRLRNAGLRLVNRTAPLKRLLVKRALG
ncbi:MAG TPA: UbiH/UbiF family hydroxylase [Burkholderiales bacterium]|nr:UbiH/UbiF family hydroxylase [Burkholderiales bacterium]